MKQYTKAELELLLLETKDVILTSSPQGLWDDPNHESAFGFDDILSNQ